MDTAEQKIAQPDKQQTWLGDVKVGVSGLRVIYCVIKHQKIVFWCDGKYNAKFILSQEFFH